MLRKNQVPLRFSAMAGTCLLKMHPTLVLLLRLYVDSHKPSNYYYNCLAMDHLPGKDGRKEEATSQQHIQLRLQTL